MSVLDNIVCGVKCFWVVVLLHINLGCEGFGCVCRHGTRVFHLVGTLLFAVLVGEIKVFEHVMIYRSPCRTGEIALLIVAQDGYIAECSREHIISPGAQKAHFAAVSTIGLQLAGGCHVFRILFERDESSISSLNDTVILIPHFVQSPEGIIILILADIDEKLLVIRPSRPHIIVTNGYLWVDNPVHCARAHLGINA